MILLDQLLLGTLVEVKYENYIWLASEVDRPSKSVCFRMHARTALRSLHTRNPYPGLTVSQSFKQTTSVPVTGPSPPTDCRSLTSRSDEL